MPAGVPERPEEIRRTLSALGVRPSRRRGQSFLADPFVADAEAALVTDIVPGPILEIGGGLGILTAALLRRGVRLLAVVERDPRLARFLQATFGDSVSVREEDATSTDLAGVRCVVGNLPYSLATPILLRCFAARVPRTVFLVQREVAERLAASPGTRRYGRLALAARLYGEVELFQTVPARAFEPTPEVEGRLAVHRARIGPLPVPSVPVFERAVRTLFRARRKQLGNLLPALAGSSGAADRLAEASGWPPGWSTRRPEELPPEAFFALATHLAAPVAPRGVPVDRRA